MADWSILKGAIAQAIAPNGNQEITGELLQQTLANIVDAVGENSTFMGVASPGTNPGSHDGPIFYAAATPGSYANFSQITLLPGEIAFLVSKNGTWTKQTLLGAGSIITEFLAPLSITEGKIANGAVTREKLAEEAVSVRNIEDEAVTAMKLSDNAVTTLKIEDEAVTREKLSPEVQEALDNATGGTGSIADGSVTTAKIADGAVTTAKIGAGAVNKERLADEAVTNSKIKDGTISIDKLSSTIRNLLDWLQDGTAIQDGAITMAKLAEEVQEAILAGGSGGMTEIPDGSVTREKLDEQVGGVVDNAEELFAEYPTKNLFVITRKGGFLGSNGAVTDNSKYDSALIPLEPGETYYVHTQEGLYNYTRVFTKSSDGVYTQVTYTDQIWSSYTTPTDGKEYYLQVVFAHFQYDGNPVPDPDAKVWVTKGHVAQKYIPSVAKIDIPSLVEPKEAKYEGSINILAIGNSYSRDALSYVPFLLADMIPEIDVTIGILYKGSCTLAQHYNLINTNGNYEEFDLYTSKNGRWVTTNANTNIDYILRDTVPWNIITLQQQSNASRDYGTYQPYLNDIIDLLQLKVQVQNTPVKIGWILTPAYADGSSSLGSDTSDSMFTKICEAVKSVMDNTAVEFFWPCGTAVQNARTTSLKNLGATGGLMADGLHLQEGIPCMLEAYVAASRICDMVGKSYKGNILGNSVIAGSKIVGPIWNVPQQNGSTVGTADDKRLAQKCSIMALKKPLEITTIDF